MFRAHFARKSLAINAAVSNNSKFLGDADFSNVTFAARANFNSSTFASYIRFSGEKDGRAFGEISLLNLEHAWIIKPEHISFHALKLKPYWFINVDARKFEFVKVNWEMQSLVEEIEYLRRLGKSYPHRLLSIAYRSLAVNAEENHRYGEASKLRYSSMDAHRLGSLRGAFLLKAQWILLRKSTVRLQRSLTRDWGREGRTKARLKQYMVKYGKSLSLLHWLYWAASGYGERVTRAAIMLTILLLLFAASYSQVGFARKVSLPVGESTATTVLVDEIGAPLPWSKTLPYSLAVMSFQKPEPRPITTAAQMLVVLEAIIGPVQAALLALAIRRRFMR